MKTGHLLGLLLLLACTPGCAADDDGLATPLPRHDAGPGGASDASIDAAVGPSGLPCEVQDVLVAHCASCHGGVPAGGATVSLMTRDQLLSASPTVPTLTLLDRAIEQMRSGAMPPMPASPVPDAEIVALETWRTAGAPEGTCVPVNDPFAGPDTCTSGRRWTSGNLESPLMRPGGACISCHTSMREGPRPPLTLAGTVYGSGREVDDCNGVGTSAADPIEVVVTDATMREIVMAPNAAGNFFSQTAVTFPITAVVRYQGRERAMVTRVPSGDCNGCHTLRGDMMAPGRIVLP
jgi:mono/diheme cytochrome c family protein